MAYNGIKLPGAFCPRGKSRTLIFTESGELFQPGTHRQARLYSLQFSLNDEGRAFVQQLVPVMSKVELRNNDKSLTGQRGWTRAIEVGTCKQLIHAKGTHSITLGESGGKLVLEGKDGVLTIEFRPGARACRQEPLIEAATLPSALGSNHEDRIARFSGSSKPLEVVDEPAARPASDRPAPGLLPDIHVPRPVVAAGRADRVWSFVEQLNRR
jgi:hypothetical protein